MNKQYLDVSHYAIECTNATNYNDFSQYPYNQYTVEEIYNPCKSLIIIIISSPFPVTLGVL